ncbi:MAG TPA: HD domain-containing protein, partial [candidate division Zixibacteria bacterium]|nr:HD domain-containing protein [candidate division Zixibacteria bacterium]
MEIVTLDTVASDPEVKSIIAVADRNLGEIGYTEHGNRHLAIVSERASKLLLSLDRSPRDAELAAIAGHLHDIGNVVNRRQHAISGAVLAKPILLRLGMPFDEVHRVIAAIGNHHEGEGEPVSDISAAVILADKSDVHTTRVRESGDVVADIHDRVNFAAVSSNLYVKDNGAIIGIEILIDPKVSSVMEYFEIFLHRMDASKLAAEYLGA